MTFSANFSPGAIGPSGYLPIEGRGLKQRPRAMYTLPMPPSWMNLIAWRTPALLRLFVPTCTTLLYRVAASTIFRPSQTVCDDGFSTYTCLPA